MNLVVLSILVPRLGASPPQDKPPGQRVVEPGGAILYASPEGTPSGQGSRNDPLDLRSALSRVRPEVVLELLGGIYRIPSKGLPRTSWLLEMGNDAAVERSRASGGKKSVIRAETGARVIITKDTGYPPYVSLKAFTRLENIWIGGTKDLDQNGGVVTVSGDDELEGCVLFGYYGGIADGSLGHNLYQGNLFVNCGTDNLFHALYISSQPTDSARGCTAVHNIFVGGGGYHMHLWHKPSFTQLLGNFSGDASRSLVLDGTGILARDNILWSNRSAPLIYQGDQATTARFLHNLIGPRVTDYRWSSSSGFIADSNAFLTDVPQHPFGTHLSLWQESHLPELLGIDGPSLDSAIVALERSFATDLVSILADTTIGRHWGILSSAIDLWNRDRPLAPMEQFDPAIAAVHNFAILQNFPNPFNASTVIRFNLGLPLHVTLAIYDILGRQTASLANGDLEAGPHEVVWDASLAASGIYFVRLQAGEGSFTRLMVVTR